MKTKITVLIFLSVFFVSIVSAEINFRSDEPIDFYSDIVLKDSADLNLNDRNIEGYFDNACANGLAIKKIWPNGTFQCASAEGEIGLAEIMDNNATASQELDMNDHTITNLGEPESNTDAVNQQYLTSNYIKEGGTLSDDLNVNNYNLEEVNRVETSGSGSDKVTIWDSNNSQAIAKFHEDGILQMPNGPIDMNGNSINNVDSIVFDKNESINDDQNFQFKSDSGYIDFRPSDEEHSLVIRQYDGNGKNFSAIRTNPQGTMQLKADGSTYQQLQLLDSGEVKIGEGTLNLDGNNITGVSHMQFTSGLNIEGDLDTSGGKINTDGGNIVLGEGYLSNDGDNEGIKVNEAGGVILSDNIEVSGIDATGNINLPENAINSSEIRTGRFISGDGSGNLEVDINSGLEEGNSGNIEVAWGDADGLDSTGKADDFTNADDLTSAGALDTSVVTDSEIDSISLSSISDSGSLASQDTVSSGDIDSNSVTSTELSNSICNDGQSIEYTSSGITCVTNTISEVVGNGNSLNNGQTLDASNGAMRIPVGTDAY